MRGLVVGALACTSLVVLSGPASGDEPDSTPTEYTAPPDTTPTTVADEPAPLEGSSPTTAPASDPPPGTVPDPGTTPATDLPVDVTVPPVTDPPVTDATLPPATEPTIPADGNVVPVPVTPSDPPKGGGGTSATGDESDEPAGTASHDATPMQRLVSTFPNAGIDAKVANDDGALQAMAASVVTPARDLIDVPVKGMQKLHAKLRESLFDPRSARSSWGGFGAAAPRFGPWVVLLAMAWLVRTVIASILADRTGGPRRRRWTLL
jgi:hypothetical protein